MNDDTFDNDAEGVSDDDYYAFIVWLAEITAVELREARGDAEQQKEALCRYYKRGEHAKLAVSELMDLLGVSIPSIFDMAGYSDAEGNAVIAISDSLTDEEIKRVILDDPYDAGLNHIIRT